jgi:hypothetical protein
MVVGFKTTSAISSNPANGEVYSIQHEMLKFVRDLRKVGGFLRVKRFYPQKKTDNLDITKILLKMALNIIIILLFCQVWKSVAIFHLCR